jgi:hypothetical protein
MEDLSGLRANFTSQEEVAYQYGMNMGQYIQAIQTSWKRCLHNGETEMHVVFPKEYVVDLNSILNEMGLWTSITWSAAPRTEQFQNAEAFRVVHLSVGREDGSI